MAAKSQFRPNAGRLAKPAPEPEPAAAAGNEHGNRLNWNNYDNVMDGKMKYAGRNAEDHFNEGAEGLFQPGAAAAAASTEVEGGKAVDRRAAQPGRGGARRSPCPPPRRGKRVNSAGRAAGFGRERERPPAIALAASPTPFGGGVTPGGIEAQQVMMTALVQHTAVMATKDQTHQVEP